LVMVCLYHGAGRELWLTASVLIFVTRVITFSYFIPVMLNKLMKAEKVPAAELPGIIKRWTALSPLRLITEFAALITGALALFMLGTAL